MTLDVRTLGYNALFAITMLIIDELLSGLIAVTQGEINAVGYLHQPRWFQL
jgi:hypothetical protein